LNMWLLICHGNLGNIGHRLPATARVGAL